MRLAELKANPPAVDPELGPRVRQRREQLGWSRREFAERAGISLIYAKFIERGKRQPSLAVRIRLGVLLGIPLVLQRDAESMAPLGEPERQQQPEESAASVDAPRQPRPPSGTLGAGDPVVQGWRVSEWLRYDRESRLPRRTGPPYYWR